MFRSSTYQMESISRESLDGLDVHDPSVDAEDIPTSPGHPSQHNERDRRSSYALDARTLIVWWGFEFLTWMLATLSTVIIFIVLAVFRNQPVSHWHSNITLNTVVNVVSQIAQTAILVPVATCISQLKWLWVREDAKLQDMDDINDASGGPLSSIFLLRKRREMLLVSLGAVNMILVFLFGSFAQQSAQQSLHRIANGNSSIDRSTSYQSSPYPEFIYSGTSSSGISQSAQFDSIAPQMRLAIEAGLINTDASPSTVTGDCPTGNCTWPDYLTLGICSSVDDVTPSIIAHCESPEDNRDPNFCTYTVPALKQDPPTSGTNLSRAATLFIGASDPFNHSYPALNTLVEFYVIYLKNLSVLEDSEPSYTNQLLALKGTLDLCLYKYNTTVTNGITNTKLIDKSTDLDWQTSDIDSDHPLVLTTAPGLPDAFSIDKNVTKYFRDYLSLVTFTGQAAEKEKHELSEYTSDSALTLAATLRGSPPDIDGLRGQLENLATSMTNGLRTTSDTPSSWNGTAYASVPYFDIQWSWLVVPILAIVLALLFLLVTISESHRHRIPAWKSSQIAAMQSLGPEARKAVGDLGMRTSRSQGTGDVVVRLVQGNGRWQLVKSPFGPSHVE